MSITLPTIIIAVAVGASHVNLSQYYFVERFQYSTSGLDEDESVANCSVPSVGDCSIWL